MTQDEMIAKLTEMLEIQQKLQETAIDMLKPAIEAEREACAKLCETISNTQANMNAAWRNGCRDAATEIRARGQA
jgi:hypothetical protein